MPFVLLWGKAFALTLALEALVAIPLLRPARADLADRSAFSVARRLAAVAFANLASHPAVWFVFPVLGAGHPDLTLALSELWAVASELGLYCLVFPLSALGLRRAVLSAGLANAASFASGWALRAAVDWP